MQLFVRTNRGANQTKEGDFVVDFSRDVLDRYEQLRGQLESLEQKSESTGKVVWEIDCIYLPYFLFIISA